MDPVAPNQLCFREDGVTLAAFWRSGQTKGERALARSIHAKRTLVVFGFRTGGYKLT